MPDPSHSTTAETLLIEGPDTNTFAQGQFTTAVTALETGRWQFSAWLDAQGRVRNFFHLARLAPDRLLLLLRGGSATEMKIELSRFVFRARLSMHADGARVIDTADALPMHEVHEHDGSVRLGCGDHSLALASKNETDNRWRALQVTAGWPWLPEALLGTCLSPALSLHRLHAVSLDKGCYPGQEIVARLHYRGGNKRQLCRVGLSQPIPSGTSLNVGDGDMSIQLLDVVTNDRAVEALALCHSDFARAPKPLSASHAGQTIAVEWLETWPA
jgi:folate-binding protein YgfZ